MEPKKIYLVYRASPTLGRPSLAGASGSSFFDQMLYGNKADNYISTLQKELQQENLNWCVYKDDTESDIEKLIAQNADLLICIPSLKYQFYTNGFDKKNIIYLSTMEYANSVTSSVIQRIKVRGK